MLPNVSVMQTFSEATISTSHRDVFWKVKERNNLSLAESIDSVPFFKELSKH